MSNSRQPASRPSFQEHTRWRDSRLRSAGGAELRRDRVEGHVRVRADRLNGGQADDHDQSQHHGVFHRGRAIFRDEKTLHFQSEILHGSCSPVRRSRRPGRADGIRSDTKTFQIMSLTRCCAAPRRTRRRPALHRVLTQHLHRSSPRHRRRIARNQKRRAGNLTPRSTVPSVRQPGYRNPVARQSPKTQQRTRITALCFAPRHYYRFALSGM